jgi:hypothetical protein
MTERDVVRALVRRALDAGYVISVDNGGDTYEIDRSSSYAAVVRELFATDEERLILSKDGRAEGYILLVYGNNPEEVVADYTLSLAHLVELEEKT